MGAAPASEPPAVVEPPPVVVVKPAPLQVTREVALPPPVADPEAVKREAAKAAADEIAKAHLARAAANPAPVTRRPMVASAPPQKRSRTPMTIAAAAVIVLAIGAAEGARRLGYEWPSRAATSQGEPVQAMSAAPDIPVAQNVVTEKPSAARGQIRAAAPTKAKAKIPTPIPTKAPAVTTAKAPGTVKPPAGRVFERAEVDEAPRIVTRVAPRLPANLRGRASNAVVVVRVLVSRTGQPSRVNLLRGSSLGRATDDAVVAAVTQWKFSPARKRGEPVNCWYNMGVPLSQAD